MASHVQYGDNYQKIMAAIITDRNASRLNMLCKLSESVGSGGTGIMSSGNSPGPAAPMPTSTSKTEPTFPALPIPTPRYRPTAKAIISRPVTYEVGVLHPGLRGSGGAKLADVVLDVAVVIANEPEHGNHRCEQDRACHSAERQHGLDKVPFN